MRNVILQGDSLAVLRTLPSNYVQCVFTSPPYIWLRDYNLPPTVWDGDEACHHVWKDTTTRDSRLQDTAAGSKQKSNGGSVEWRDKPRSQAMCIHCGAWLGCLGLEPTYQLYIQHLVQIFREVRRVLRNDGTLWINIGDSFANDTKWGGTTGGKHVQELHGDNVMRHRRHSGLAPKNLMLIPARLAIALQEDGWICRQDVIWHKPNAMCESVEDRPSCTYEHVFLFAKSERYFYDADAIREPLRPKTLTTFGTKHRPQGNDALGLVKSDNWGRTVDARQPRLAADGSMAGANKRNVWVIATQPFSAADLGFTDVEHFATFPPKLAEIPILAGTSPRACEHCGSPWERVTERIQFDKASSESKYEDSAMKATRLHGSRQAYRAMGLEGPPAPKTVGWQPTCRCKNDGKGKCIVMDIFAGSGTVPMVALQHGRDYLGIELNSSYIEMAERRISTTQQNLWTTEGVI